MAEVAKDPRYEEKKVVALGAESLRKYVIKTMLRWHVDNDSWSITHNPSRNAGASVYYINDAGSGVRSRLEYADLTGGRSAVVIRALGMMVQWNLGILGSNITSEQGMNRQTTMFEVGFFIYEISRHTGISQSILRGMYIDFGGNPMANMDTPEEYIAAARLAVQE